MVPDYASWRLCTVDQIIQRGPTLLYGLILRASVTGGDVTLYAAQDAITGAKIATFEGIANESRPLFFPVPIYCDRGLYIDVGSNVDDVLVIFAPLPSSKPE